MKRVTPTPNHFTISIPSWPVKALVIFFGVLLFAACEDELDGIGTRKNTSRFKVNYREFEIPVTTVQTDSVNGTALVSETLLCGIASDPNFGTSTAMLYTQFRPTTSNLNKIDQTNKSDFNVIDVKLIFNLNDEYYVYGDTSNTTLHYSLHTITDTRYWITQENFTTSNLQFDPTPIAFGSFEYKHDSIVSHRQRNTNSSFTDDRYDSIAFQLPLAYGDHLLDSALSKGIFNGDALDKAKTDSVFRLAFPGFALKPIGPMNRIMGFKTELGNSIQQTSRVVVDYTYVENGSTLFGQLLYFNSTVVSNTGLGFSNITVDRTGTPLEELSQTDPADRNVSFNAPDNFAYLQAGTGLYAKLDLTLLHNYFDASPDSLENVAINSAELIIEVEPDAVRHHQDQPKSLNLRIATQANSLFRTPIISTSSGQSIDNRYAINYNSILNGLYLDARDDEGLRLSLPIKRTSSTQPQYYQAFLSDFVQAFLKIPVGFTKIYNVGLVPSPEPFGKTLKGLSFKKDKVKLRVYYTKAL